MEMASVIPLWAPFKTAAPNCAPLPSKTAHRTEIAKIEVHIQLITTAKPPLQPSYDAKNRVFI